MSDASSGSEPSNERGRSYVNSSSQSSAEVMRLDALGPPSGAGPPVGGSPGPSGGVVIAS